MSTTKKLDATLTSIQKGPGRINTPRSANATGNYPFLASPIPVNGSKRGHLFPDRYHRQKPLGGRTKRLLDVIISILMLMVLAPALILMVCLIYLTMGRPIFFSHERIGFSGVRFKCYKFRTMVRDAGEVLNAYLRENPAAQEEWRACHKLKKDPRITFVGMLLRKSSLDELPQLINVLRGDMACVGPRPVTPDEISRYRASARYYLQTRPGLTGLWQVRGRSNTSYSYRVALDRRYVTGWTIWLDMKILAETVPALLRFHETV